MNAVDTVSFFLYFIAARITKDEKSFLHLLEYLYHFESIMAIISSSRVFSKTNETGRALYS